MHLLFRFCNGYFDNSSFEKRKSLFNVSDTFSLLNKKAWPGSYWEWIWNNSWTGEANNSCAHESENCLRSFPDMRNNDGNIHNINIRVNTKTVRHDRTYVIWFPTRHNDSINDDKKTILSLCPHPADAATLLFSIRNFKSIWTLYSHQAV